MPLLDEIAAQQKLLALPGWEISERHLHKCFQFDGFPEAVAFVTRVAFEAERHNHHPDLLIQYNKVTFSVMTHDAGGLTEKDFALAAQVEQRCAHGSHGITSAAGS